MGLDGCGKCMKFTMFLANLAILSGGIALIVLGSLACGDKKTFEKLMGSNLYMSAAYILIVTGVIVVIISVIGCLGAIREIKCLLVAYFIIMFCMFVIMLVGGILGAVFRADVRDKMRQRMKTTLISEYGFDREANETWDVVQTKLKCCGFKPNDTSIDKPMDIWKLNPYFQDTIIRPSSCCRKIADIEKYVEQGQCQTLTSDHKDIAHFVNDKDCYDAALELIGSNAMELGGVGIGIACVLILGMIFSMVLCKVID